MNADVFIIGATRTPIGSWGGKLASVSAIDLGIAAGKGVLEKTAINKECIDEAIIGNVISANLGQAPTRQVVKGLGLSDSVISTTINKVCASGLKAVMIGAQSIQLGNANVVLAGGMESMSNIPFYLSKARFGYGYGNGELIDGLSADGLTNVYDGEAMGVFADRTAATYGITREEQDEYALNSYSKSATAWKNGLFQNEIFAVEVTDKKGNIEKVNEDEEYLKIKPEKFPLLKASFSKDGTVTAANASTINDGAAVLLLASSEAVNEYNLKPLAKIVAYADAEQAPEWFTTTPILATQKLLKKAEISIDQIDLFEVNEAFSVVPMVYMKELGIDPIQMNIHGGAVSLGHPLGASGARILTTLVHALELTTGKYGVAVICNGGGGASAMLIENLQL